MSERTAAEQANEQQEDIIQAPADQDLLIVAGAGSGKTYVMTKRIAKLITDDGVAPHKILGLTFTRKAAGELLDRVTKETSSLSPDQSAGRPGLSYVGFLHPTVSTYDAFFQSIVRQYGALVGLDGSAAPLSQAGAYQLASEVVGEHVAQYAQDLFSSDAQDFGSGTDSASSGASFDFSGPADSFGRPGQDGRSGGSDGNDSTSSEIGKFPGLVKDTLALNAEIGNSMIGPECDTVEAAIGRIRAWDQEFSRLVGPMKEKVDQALADLDQTKPEDLSKRTEEVKGYKERLKALTDKANLCDCLLKVTRRREMLVDFVLAYDQAKKDQGLVEFSDFTIGAFRLVAHYPWICQEFRQKYSHVFLDEYQDTSITQAKLLNALFHKPLRPGEGTRPAGAQDLVSFVTAVGDPFQSIYAWRGASPGAFAMFLDDYGMEESQIHKMTYTRRNPAIILDAANRLTAGMRRPAPDPLGRTATSVRKEVPVEKLEPTDPKEEAVLGLMAYKTMDQEADGIARFAKEAIARARDRVQRRKRTAESSGEPMSQTDYQRELNKTHVALLLRSKRHMDSYLQGLTRQGLTYQVVGDQSLWESPDAQDLLALLTVVTDHTDSPALLRLLATPRFGLAKKDLIVLAALAKKADQKYKDSAVRTLLGLEGDGDLPPQVRTRVEELKACLPTGVYLTDLLTDGDLLESSSPFRSGLSPQALSRLRKASAVIMTVKNRLDQPMEEILQTAARALTLDVDSAVGQAIEAGIRAGKRETDDQASWEPGFVPVSCLPAFLSLAQTYHQEIAEGQTASIQGFVAWLNANKENPGVDSPVSFEQEDGPQPDVVVMTIHQAKGLQWDAVAVGGMVEGVFPSNQGDHLKATVLPRTNTNAGMAVDAGSDASAAAWGLLDEDFLADLVQADPDADDGYRLREDPAGRQALARDGAEWGRIKAVRQYKDPVYSAEAQSWVFTPTAVPTPVKADKSLLPAFPDASHLAGAFADVDSLEKALTDDETSQAVSTAETRIRLRKKGASDRQETALDYLLRAAAEGDQKELDRLLTPQRTKTGKEKSATGNLIQIKKKISLALGELYSPGLEPVSKRPMSLRSQTGQALLDDERRLAYVAFTRAEYDLFLTTYESAVNKVDDRLYDSVHFTTVSDALQLGLIDPPAAGGGARAQEEGRVPAVDPGRKRAWLDSQAMDLRRFASDFWLELFGAYSRLEQEDPVLVVADASSLSLPPQDACVRPVGFFLGLEGPRFRDQVVGEALQDSLRSQVVDRPLLWPMRQDSLTDYVLESSARMVRAARGRVQETGLSASADQPDSPPGEAGSGLVADSVPLTGGTLTDGPLAQAALRTRAWRRSSSFVPGQEGRGSGESSFSSLASSSFADYLTNGLVNVTAIQKEFSHQLEEESQEDGKSKKTKGKADKTKMAIGKAASSASAPAAEAYYRPMPQATSDLAQAGTDFHAWAQEFILPASLSSSAGRRVDFGEILTLRQRQKEEVELECAAQTGREEGAEEVADLSPSPRMTAWKKNLIHSVWASRPAFAVEQSITDTIEDGRGGRHHFRGSLDAVFYGSLDDPDKPETFTIVDWKTGHKPTDPGQVKEKLAQLDIYRLMFSDLMGIDIDSIDAELYYVGEKRKEDRAIVCPHRSRRRIEEALTAALVARIRQGLLDDDEAQADPDTAAFPQVEDE